MRNDHIPTKAGRVFPELASGEELALHSATELSARRSAHLCHLSGQFVSILVTVALAAAVARALAELI